jgi:alpha-N-arabinofuranosidase
MGAWRARNGHPAPYRIKYWQVGNERGGQEYEARLRAFCEAMKAADPAIQLFSSFPTPSLIKDEGQWLDFVCPHHYSHDLNWMENDLFEIERLIRQNAPAGRPVHIAVTEWNTTAGDAGPRRAMLWTLANALACSRYHNLLHRHAESVKIANRSNLINSFCSGIVQTDNHRLYETPTYYAQRLYATLAGTRPLTVHSAIPANVGPDLSATLSADGATVTLFAVNDSLEPISRPLDFSDFGSKPQKVSVWTLTDREHVGEPDVTNSFERPERVIPTPSSFRIRDGNFTYTFPALSLTVLRFKIQP